MASAVLAGCALGGSALDRPAAESLNMAAYPPGAYRAVRGVQLLPLINPMRGSASYDAHAAAPLLYVSNLGAKSVEVFHQGGRAQQPIATITNGVVFPVGLTTDSSGNLYVTDSGEYNGAWVVQRYAPGATSPGKTYTTDLSEPCNIAIAKDGTIYIANFNAGGAGWVAVYPKGNASKEYRLSDSSGGSPVSVALDSKQDLYAMWGRGNQGSSVVYEYKPGATTGKNLNLDFAYGAGIQVDSAGNLLAVQQVLPSEIFSLSARQNRTVEVHRLAERRRALRYRAQSWQQASFRRRRHRQCRRPVYLPVGKVPVSDRGRLLQHWGNCYAAERVLTHCIRNVALEVIDV